MATFSEEKDTAILQQQSKHKAKAMLACNLVTKIFIERNTENSIKVTAVYVECILAIL